MKNKKLKTLVASLALVGAIAVGATLAYFTDSQEAVNTITMGHVDIDLDEPNFPDDKEIPAIYLIFLSFKFKFLLHQKNRLNYRRF